MKLYVFGNSHIWALVGGEGRSDEEIKCSAGGLMMTGWKFSNSGATAYGLLKKNSVSRAGERIIEILDADPEPVKDMLLVFGEVDVTEHIGQHGVEEDESVATAISRYVEYIKTLIDRQDTGRILIASAIPHIPGFRNQQCERIRRVLIKWCSSLKEAVASLPKVSYVDWLHALPIDKNYDLPAQYVLHPNDPMDCHMSPSNQPILLEEIHRALQENS